MALAPYVIRWDGKRHDVAVAGNDEKEQLWGAAIREGFLELLPSGLISVTDAGIAYLLRRGYDADVAKIERRRELRHARIVAQSAAEAKEAKELCKAFIVSKANNQDIQSKLGFADPVRGREAARVFCEAAYFGK